MTAAKQIILSAIRRHHLPEVPLPSLDQSWITYPDARQQFASVLESVGGRVVFVPNVAAIAVELASSPAWKEAKRTVSLVDGIPGNVDLNQLDNPHATEDIDFALLPAELAAAENGAVWIADSGVKHRAIFFIVQHLALVVSADKILHNMHEAYQRLSFNSPGFGAFISGPSKTADIEQSLVVGAHGPRSVTVFVTA